MQRSLTDFMPSAARKDGSDFDGETNMPKQDMLDADASVLEFAD